MNEKEYNELEGLRSSELKQLIDNPAKYKYWQTRRKESSTALNFGIAYHLLALEPHRKDEIVIAPKFSGTGSRAAKAEWEAVNAGKIFVTESEMLDLRAMLSALREKPEIVSILDAEGKYEAAAQFDIAGVKCKFRADKITDRIVDLKTARSISQHAITKAIVDYGYHISDAFYNIGAVEAGLIEKDMPMQFIFQDKNPPFEVVLVTLDDVSRDFAKQQIMYAIEALKQFQVQNYWPGKYYEPLQVSLPLWYFKGEEISEEVEF